MASAIYHQEGSYLSEKELATVFENKEKFILKEAVEKKHLNEFEELKKELARGEFQINSQLKDGRTPLFVSVCNNNIPAVKFLVEGGADMEIHEKANGNTALMAAISLGYNEVTDYLITKGADIHAVNNNGNTIVHFAAICGNLAILKYAYEHGCDIDQKDKEGNCAILFATGNNYEKVVEYLLERDADIDVIDSEKMSLLHVCIQHNRNKILNSILFKSRKTINKYYGDYQTALYWAASTEKFNSVFVLLKYGANPNLNDCLNHSPLFWAVFYQNYEMVEMLIDYGADIHCRYRIGGLASIHGGHQTYGDSILRTAMRRWTTSITDLIRAKGGEDHREY
jgi:ankyrin repeat protein